MRMAFTLAIVLAFLGLTASVSSAQIVTIDKITLAAPPVAGQQDTVKPEGKVSIGPGIGAWNVVIEFGTIAGGTFTKFPDTTVAKFPFVAPTAPGATWRFPAPDFTKATWGAPYYCRAELQRTVGLITTVSSTAYSQVK